jgi:outer membrane protein assembly factor BamB
MGFTSTTLGSLAAILTAGILLASDWPQWRGPHRDDVAKESGLLQHWPKQGPPLLWKVSGLGSGYSSVVIQDDRIFTTGDLAQGEYLVALSRQDGSKLWSARLGEAWRDGGSRSTPTLDGNRVYALTPHGDLVCVGAADGHEIWRKSMEHDFGGRMMSGWGYSESPLIDGDKLICTPGGDRAGLVALDKKSGELLWKAAVPNADGAGYASPIVAEVGGIRLYLTLLGKAGGLVGVRASDGKLQFRHNKVANGTANIPTPLVHKDLVFYSTGYGDGGCALLRMVPANGSVRLQEVYLKRAGQLQNHHGGVIIVGEHIYGGHGHNNGFPFCLDLKTGKELWGKPRGAGAGSAAVTYADGDLYFRYENGVMALVGADPDHYEVKGTFHIPQGSTPSWSHPVVLDGRLYLRDQDRMLVFDVKDHGVGS